MCHVTLTTPFKESFVISMLELDVSSVYYTVPSTEALLKHFTALPPPANTCICIQHMPRHMSSAMEAIVYIFGVFTTFPSLKNTSIVCRLLA